MKSIILSIKPQYAELIYSGQKDVEFRKRIPSKPFHHVWIYETAPVQMITGCFYVKSIWKDDSKEIFKNYLDNLELGYDLVPYPCHLNYWNRIAINLNKPGISYKEYRKYVGYTNYQDDFDPYIVKGINCIFISMPTRVVKPFSLADWNIKTPPQNFMYAPEL